MVFGLFKILGYNFSPRFRDLDDQRFWRATMPGVETGSYGAPPSTMSALISAG
jgi:TnpA family transposase